MRTYRNAALFLFLVAVLSIAGCSGTTDGPSTEGKAFLLSAEPENAEGINSLKSGLITGLNPGGEEVVLIGRVGGGENETWDSDQAVFLIRDLDLVIEKHDHGDNHDNCKFCQAAKAKELESMALVRVVDETGKAVAMDARQLLGLEEEQIIVAEGEASIEDGTFVFNAKKVFIRP
jgi:hypothetical protein